MNKDFIIGLAGKSGSGKDTVGMYIYDFMRYRCKSLKKDSFANILKEVFYKLTGVRTDKDKNEFICKLPIFDTKKELLDDVKDFTKRELLIKTAEAITSVYGKDFFVNYLFDRHKFTNKLIITDVRFKNEFKKIREKNGFIVKVIRDDVKLMDNYTEKDLDGLTNDMYDYVIYNNGTHEDLRKNTISMLETLELV